MQRSRPLTEQRLYGMGFVAIVLMIILSIHSAFVLIAWAPKLWAPGAVAVLFVYHVLFANLLMSFYQCVMTDPGVVPPNWGFYMGDETKRRRYCKMCNVWKPDRTHHCGICNRCVLNMDHHCPWINNCVGFYNRKFFIQLLSYVYFCLIIVVIFTIPEMYSRMTGIYCWEDPETVILGIAFLMAAFLICTLTNFIKFHMKLVLENYTTIENLDREEGAKSKFDIGRRRNWEQVFGQNSCLWWLPVHTQASRPIGDGVRWRVHYTRVIDEDEELPAEDEGMSQASKLLNQGNGNRSGR